MAVAIVLPTKWFPPLLKFSLLGFSKVARLAEKELNYIESEEPTHTFDNLKPNTSYKEN